MAKLILSSCDFGHPASAACIRANLPKPIEACRVLFFPNEKATAEAIRGGKYVRRLAGYGFSEANIRVFDYFSPTSFAFPAIDVIYISGGNTFGTMRRLRASGGDQIIRSCVQAGAAYIGGSAGAHIASADIAHVRQYDADIFGLDDFSGLGLFDGILICHADETRQTDADRLRQSGRRVIVLTDADVIVIDTDAKSPAIGRQHLT